MNRVSGLILCTAVPDIRVAGNRVFGDLRGVLVPLPSVYIAERLEVAYDLQAK
jgi:hypothetical protein